MNPSACEILGYSKQELLQLSLKDILFEEDLVNNQLKFEEVKSGKTVRNERRIKRKDGTAIDMAVSTKMVEGMGFLMFGHDITERKKAETALKRSETFLKEAQRLAKLGSWNFELRDDKLTWSEEMYRVFGVDKESFLETQNAFIDLIDEEYREFVRQTRNHTQQTGEPFTIEYAITTLLGEKKIIEEFGYSEKDAKGNVIRLFGTAQDITERKLLETRQKEILEQQSLFVSIVNSSDDAIISKTLDGIITSWNKGAEKIFGYAGAEVIGKHISLLIPNNHLYEEDYIVGEIRKGNHIDHFETERVNKN